MSDSGELKDLSLTQLFRLEAEGQFAVLTAGLLALEKGDGSQLEAMMRAAHSLKGAARIIGVETAVSVAHALEDCFVAAQHGRVKLGREHVDRLLTGVDLLQKIAASDDAELPVWDAERRPQVDAFVEGLQAAMRAGGDAGEKAEAAVPTTPAGAEPVATAATAGPRVLRVTADHLNRLLGLAGESLVESRRLQPFTASFGRLQRLHDELARALDDVADRAEEIAARDGLEAAVAAARQRLGDCREFLTQRILELDTHDRRAANLAHRLHGEALAVRMRPFADGIGGFSRMVRDVARELGKEVEFAIVGEETQVDRDILARLEAPLGHLLRNAIDHGIEPPAEREAAGKPPTGRITLEARHSAGVLLIAVSDDGRGVSPEVLREAVVRRRLVAPEMAPRLSEAELLEFLFLPGFSLKAEVTAISGRGVGLDVVQSMVKEVRGQLRVASEPGRGMRFQLQLPLTLSVARALLVEIAGEPYAIPLGFIARTLRLPRADVATTEGRQHFEFQGRRVALVSARDVLGRPGEPAAAEELAVVVIGELEQRYGVVVDAFLGEREVVVQPLDARLGKVKDIAAGALMEDGSPLLILDVADFVRSVEKLATAGRAGTLRERAAVSGGAAGPRKRVLVVDDSLTVRELERKLLDARGYAVEIAVDGMDGWNAARGGNFDLVITDVDMPRLDGIELTRLIKQDAKLRALPVMIMSYKDREEDRRRGLEAGADYYLTKGSFHDETMLRAVAELIGAAEEGRA